MNDNISGVQKINFREWQEFSDIERYLARWILENHQDDEWSGADIRMSQCARISLIPDWGYQTLLKFNLEIEGYLYLAVVDCESSDDPSLNGMVRCGDDVFVEENTDNGGRRMHSWIRLDEEGPLTFVHHVFETRVRKSPCRAREARDQCLVKRYRIYLIHLILDVHSNYSSSPDSTMRPARPTDVSYRFSNHGRDRE